MRCTQCGNINLEPTGSCQVCGAALAATDPDPLSPEIGASAQAEQPLTATLYQALIGPVHTDYYLKRFARFDAAGKAGITWHWPALFVTLGWLAFRRMWTQALAFAALALTAALALFGVLPLIFGSSPEMLWSLLALYLLALALLPPLWANAVYYRHCNRRVTQALVAAADIRQTCEQLAAHSSRWRRTWVAAGVACAAWLFNGAIAAWLLAASGVLGPMGVKSLPHQAAQGPVLAASAVPAAAPATPASAAFAAAAPQAASAPVPSASAPAPAASVPKAPLPMASAPSAPASAPATAVPPVPAPAASAAQSAAQRKAPAAPKVPASAAAVASKTGKFIVAVGQFAQEKNASRAYDKLEAAGLPVHSNTVQTASGALLLIRVGPYKNLADARSAAQQVKALDLPAVVMKR